MSFDFHKTPQSSCLLSPSSELTFTKYPFPKSLFSAYAKALLKKKRGLKRGDLNPTFGVQSKLRIESQWLLDYLDICSWKSNRMEQSIPLTVAQVYAAPLQTLLLTHNDCPIPILGVVHAGNEMWSRLPLYAETDYNLRVWFGETRWKAKGFEFDLHTTVSHPQTQDIHWAARTSIFKRIPKSEFLSISSNSVMPNSTSNVESQSAPHDPTSSLQIDLPPNLGRLYGKIARDRNPIHLYPWSAKLFGFQKPIIHGMWTLGRTLAMMHSVEDCALGSLQVRFKRPISLPSRCTLNQWSLSQKTVEGHQEESAEQGFGQFEVLNQDHKVAIEGSILVKSETNPSESLT